MPVASFVRCLLHCWRGASFLSLTGLFASPGRRRFPSRDDRPSTRSTPACAATGCRSSRAPSRSASRSRCSACSQNRTPDGSYILARLSGQNLEKSGVIAGMSGSPVYFDGRLAGAVAFSWPFANEPIAGITPIASMRAIGGAEPACRSGEHRSRRRARRRDRSDGARRRRIPRRPPRRRSSRVRARGRRTAGARRCCGALRGFGASARSRLARAPARRRPCRSAGRRWRRRARRSTPTSGPAASVAALFVDGDLRLAATGTVTDRIGDKLLAFGHSAVGVSEFSMPLATSAVITVMPSALSSFKLSNSGPAVGPFERDHPYGSVGRIGQAARTVPLIVRVSAPPERQDFHLRARRRAAVPAGARGDRLPRRLGCRLRDGWRAQRRPRTADRARRPAGLAPHARAELRGRRVPPPRRSAISWRCSSFLVQNDFAPARRCARIESTSACSAGAARRDSAFAQPSRPESRRATALELQIDARGWSGESAALDRAPVLPMGSPTAATRCWSATAGASTAARLALAPAPPGPASTR